MGVSTQGATTFDSDQANLFAQQKQQQDLFAQQCAAAENAATQARMEAERAAAESRAAAERSAAESRAAAERWAVQSEEAAARQRESYNTELYRITAEAAVSRSDIPHSTLSGASSGQIHSAPTTQLMPQDFAPQQNTSYLAQNPGHIPPYSPEHPVIRYETNVSTENMVRAHRDDPVGNWATLSSDLNSGNITGNAAKERLNLFQTPTHVSDVNLPIGTEVEKSRPVSGSANQFSFSGAISRWFSNTRKLG